MDHHSVRPGRFRLSVHSLLNRIAWVPVFLTLTHIQVTINKKHTEFLKGVNGKCHEPESIQHRACDAFAETKAIKNHEAFKSSVECLIKLEMSKSMLRDCHGVFKSSIIRPLKKRNATLVSSLWHHQGLISWFEWNYHLDYCNTF